MNLLGTLFALAGLVWMIPLVRSGRLLLLAMAILVVGTVAGPFFFAIEGPIQLSVDRMMYFGMIGLAILGMRMGISHVPKVHRLDALVFGLTIWCLISAATGGAPPTGTPPIARWLFCIAMPAGMYVVARMVTIKSNDISWLQTGAIALGIYLSITALLEISGLHALVFPRYIVDQTHWEFLGRGRGPLLNPSGNGIVIAIGLTASVIAWMAAAREGKLFYSVLVVCLMLGIYATLTRSAWLGGLSAIGMIAFLYSSRWVRIIGLAVCLIFGGLAAVGFKDQLLRMKRDKNLSAEEAAKSVKLRPLLAVIAWEMFKDKPVVGHGYGYYFEKHRPYHQIREYDLPLEQARPYAQHNVFLSMLVDTGLIGLTLFLTWFLSFGATAWQLARDGNAMREVRWVGLISLGAILAYTCNGMFQDVTIIPMIHMYLFFLAGVSVTVAQTGIERAPQQRRTTTETTALSPALPT